MEMLQDSLILDFEWFANTSDYSFRDSGESWYDDFGWNPQLFPQPTQQLKKYLEECREERQVHVAGIRKPRLGNKELLELAKKKGWLAPTGGPETYARGRWLQFSDPEMRSCPYGHHGCILRHYLDSGISYWWNDAQEGENFWYTYHDWNLAELDLHHKARMGSRFFSLNRAFTPGMARLGAAVWTGDVESTWEELGAKLHSPDAPVTAIFLDQASQRSTMQLLLLVGLALTIHVLQRASTVTDTTADQLPHGARRVWSN
eukprot:Skav229913  [mRNA]  locus=scaffold877:112134:118104:+ [translate_table: standard]